MSTTMYPNGNGSSQTAFSLTSGQKATGTATPTLAHFPLNGAAGVIAKMGAMESADDNDVFDYRVWSVRNVDRVDANGVRTTVGYEYEFLGFGTATLGTQAFLGGVAAGATGRMADTITWTRSSVATTPKGPMEETEAALSSGGSRAYSPADNTDAKLFIPVSGADGLIFEFDSTTGAPLKMFALLDRVFIDQ